MLFESLEPWLIEVLKSLRKGSGTGVGVSKLIDGVVLRCNRSVDLQGDGGLEMLRMKFRHL